MGTRRIRIGVAGASGYAGGELLRLVSVHPDLELAVATADSTAGRPIGDVHPHLAGDARLAELALAPHSALESADADLVFLALPAGQSAALAARLPGEAKVVDLGPDFRLADPAAWARHYGGAHAGRWVTGLPELPGARAAIGSAPRVAAPGCYATAAILALAPLAAAGLITVEDLVVVAFSGTSGAGRSLRADLLASEVMGSASAYQAGGVHRHTPEIEQALDEVVAGARARDGQVPGSRAGEDPAPGARAGQGRSGEAPGGTARAAGASGHPPCRARVSFTPVLAPMSRGILATCTARLAEPGTGGLPGAGGPAVPDTAALRFALAAAYAGEPFVRLLPEGRWPSSGAVAGSNAVHLQAAADARSGRAIVVSAIDNLVKGAAGQAIQVANLMLGLPEDAGLTTIGVAP